MIYSAMANVIQPFHLLVITLAGWLNHHQQAVIDYLIEENRVLKEQLEGQRLRFTDEQRIRLAVKAKVLGRQALDEIETLVTPDIVSPINDPIHCRERGLFECEHFLSIWRNSHMLTILGSDEQNEFRVG